MKIILDIDSCSKCPFWKEGDRQTTDGFDEGFDWICTKTKRKENKIAGFVEWHEADKIAIPTWCPVKLKQ